MLLSKTLYIVSLISLIFSSPSAALMSKYYNINTEEALQDTLKHVFEGAELKSSPTILMEQKMGFSGASVLEVACEWVPTNGRELPSRVFIKNIVLEPPGDSANEDQIKKWHRNRQSYMNEIHFLSQFSGKLDENDIQIPRVFKILHQGKLEGSGEEAESFLFVTESMSHFTQIVEVGDNKQHLTSTLQWLAGLHATFYGKSPTNNINGGEEDDGSSVWREGTHLALAKRPQKELDALGANWEAFCEAFGWPAFSVLGARVAAIAPMIATYLSPVAHARALQADGLTCDSRGARRFTLIHGDAKPANLFFSSSSSSLSSEEEQQGEAGVSGSRSSQSNMRAVGIDFQWVGWGVGATDIIYMIATGLSDRQINSLDLEGDVLRPYYAFFSSRQQQQDYSYEELVFDFQAACVDYTRWIMACRLPGETPAKYAARRIEMDPNLGAYRRSEAMMLWLLSRVEEYLPVLEARMMKG